MSETNQQVIQQYYTRTQAAISELSGHLGSIPKGTHSKDDIEKAAFEISRLRKDYVDSTSFLPSYDQRLFDKQLKDLEGEAEQLRISAAPQSKFAFKRKAPKPFSPAPSIPQQVTATATSTEAREEPPTSGLCLSGHSRKYLTLSSLSYSWSSASDLTIADLDHCVVNLVIPGGSAGSLTGPIFTALHAKNLSNTVLILPIIDGSALLHDLTNCVIALGSRQFRIHTSSQVDVYISIASNPIIEHSSAIRFADYPSVLQRSSETDSSNASAKSNYLAVQDFSHIRATPSPNWSALPEDATLPEDRRWSLFSAEDVEETLQWLLPTRTR